MKIIKATTENIKVLTVLFDLYRQFYEQTSDLKSAETFFTDRIKNSESVIFLAVDEDTEEGMGFVQLYPSFTSVGMKRMWILNDLFVHKDHRKKGVAEALMEQVRKLAVDTNAKGIILETRNSNVQAKALYDKLGYENDTEHSFYFLKTDK